MHIERDSRGIFVSRGRSSIPTSPLISPRPHSATPSNHTHIPSSAGRHRLPEVHRFQIQLRYSPTSSIEVVVEEPTSPTKEVIFLSSIAEQLLGQVLDVPSEEK